MTLASAAPTAKHIVAFGELLMRLSPPGDERLLQSAMLVPSIGGCEANVAVGLAQLGVSVEYVTRVPRNPIGDAALRALHAEGVRTGGGARGGDRLGLYFLERGADLRPLRSVYDRAHSAFTQLSPSELDLDVLFANASWMHTSGIVAAVGDAAYETLQYIMTGARARGVRVSFDCNYRPALWQGRDPRPLIQPLLPQVDLLIGNPGAFDVMVGEQTRGAMPEPPEALAETAARIHARFGISQLAITQRDVRDASTHAWRAWLWRAEDQPAHGAYVLHDGGQWVVRVVDRVGGGDAFAAALLAQLQQADHSPAHAIRFATAAGAHKLTVPGDFPRYSTDEIERLLQLAPRP